MRRLLVVCAGAVAGLVLSGCVREMPPPSFGYVPAEEMGVMTIGLDDHDYDRMVDGVVREMITRGLPKGYCVALGPVDTRDCPYDVRIRQVQKSLMVALNKQGDLKFMSAVDAMAGGSSIDEIYKIIEFNWMNRNPMDVQDLQTLGKLAQINGLLCGRVSSIERSLGRNGREITYRFVWELINTENGVLQIAHEEKIRKNVR